MTGKEETTFKEPSAWLAGSLTFIWFFLIFLYIFQCKTGFVAVDRMLGWDPDKFGSFISGAFAPVAFFWLAYSVRMQKDELRLQRKELKETRIVLSEQKTAQENSALHAEKLAILNEKILEQSVYDNLFKNYNYYLMKLNKIARNMTTLEGTSCDGIYFKIDPTSMDDDLIRFVSELESQENLIEWNSEELILHRIIFLNMKPILDELQKLSKSNAVMNAVYKIDKIDILKTIVDNIR